MRKRWLWIAAALVAAALFAAQCAPGIIEDMQRRQGLAHADALMKEGEYEEAYEALIGVVPARRKHQCGLRPLLPLQRAHRLRARQCGQCGHESAPLRRLLPEDQWSEQTQAFVETVAEEAEALAAQQRAEAAAEAAAVRAAYEERVRTEPPFVGMYVRDIDNTPLGDGKISDHERRYVDGKLVDVYIYDYYDEDGEVIYSARTVGGEVTEVWPGGYDPPITFSSPRRDYEEEEEEDRFNASSYANEEDFYDDHYDDFFDYEEAADYYREHTE